MLKPYKTPKNPQVPGAARWSVSDYVKKAIGLRGRQAGGQGVLRGNQLIQGYALACEQWDKFMR
jgi:hypothetical protein